jgi:hypothetical protein
MIDDDAELRGKRQRRLSTANIGQKTTEHGEACAG